MKAKVNKVTIQILQDAIFALDVEAIINDTDPTLSLPPSVSDLAGYELVNKISIIGFCDVGSAIITGAGNLPTKHIIHTATPKWGEASARGQLAKCTWSILELAEENQIKSLAIPPLAVGNNGYPIENCARTMLQEIIDFTFEQLRYLRKINICASTDIEFDTFKLELTHQLEDLKASGDGKIRV